MPTFGQLINLQNENAKKNFASCQVISIYTVPMNIIRLSDVNMP